MSIKIDPVEFMGIGHVLDSCSMPNLYDFLDYREYLREYYMLSKKKHAYFSYKYMGDKVGMDPSFIAKVLIKNLHIADKVIPNFIKLLKLNEYESEYFEVMVHFGKSKTEKKTKVYFDKLQSLRKFTAVRLEGYQLEFYSKWYYSAIRSALGFIQFEGDYKQLASSLIPPISVSQAKEAIQLLLQLDMIHAKAGQYYLTHNHIATGKEVERSIIEEHQKSVMSLAIESISNLPQDVRNFGTLTMAVDGACFNNLVQILRDCRESIQKCVNEVESPDRVYQLNMQLFPLSKPVKNP